MSEPQKFIFEPLDPVRHRREEFDCGVTVLNVYLQRNARREMEAGLAVCFVAVPDNDRGCIAGFFTLSATTVAREDLPDTLTKGLARYRDFPATLLGRLARSLCFKGEGLGDRLMISAFSHSANVADHVASWAIVTDPIDKNARRFYEEYGFMELTMDRMFLPMETIGNLLQVKAP